MNRSSARHVLVALAPRWIVRSLARRHYVRAIPAFFEPDAGIACSLLRSGETAVDVGANVGWYTYLLALAVGPAGTVYSIEPVPPVYQLLRHVTRKLQLGNVTPINTALSHRSGEAIMRVPIGEDGLPNYYRSAIVTAEPGTDVTIDYTVNTRTLDDILGDKTVTLIKVDVEGHELATIRGGRLLLERCRPALLIEVSSDPDDQTSDAWRLRKLLEDLGYEMFYLDGGVLRARRIGAKSINYFFLQPKHCSRISVPLES